MKRLVHISRKKILNQIIAGNIAIAVVTIAVIGVIAVFTSYGYTRTRFNEESRLQMEYNVARTESELERIVKLPFAVNSRNQNIQELFRYAYSGNLPDFSARFSEFVGLYADYSNIESMWIYDGEHTIIETPSGLKQSSNFDGWKRLTDLCYQASKNYTYMTPYISEMNSDGNYRNIVSVVSPLNANDRTYKSGCVIINVNMTNLINSISNTGEGKGSFFIVNSKNNSEIIIRRQDMFSQDDINRIMNVQGSGDIYLGGERYYTCVRESRIIPRYMYVLAVPYSELAAEMNGVYLKFFFVILCLIIVEIIIMLIISKYIYRPLRTILSNANVIFSKEPEAAQKGSYDELAVLNAYMTSLQEKLNSKSEKLDEYFYVIKQNAGQRIIDGDWEDEDEIRGILEECGVVFNSGKCTVCMLMIDNWLEITKGGKQEVNSVKNTVFTVIESTFFNSFNCICNIPQNDRVIFVIDEDSEDIEQRIDNAFYTVNDILCLQIDKTVSMARISGITSVTDISARCAGLPELAEERFCLGKKANIKEPAEKLDTKDAQKYYQTFMNSVKNAVSKRNSEDAAKAVDIFVVNMKNMPAEYIKAVILRFVYSVKNEYKAPDEADYIQNNINDIVKYSTAEELGKIILGILQDVIASFLERNTNDNISFKIKEYIDNNLDKDLSLIALGDMFKITPSYLSTLFKNSHGIGVVDYINTSRIEKAKNLLIETNMSIKDVSEAVGFINYNSFARVFKKQVGISAKDFQREAGLKSENES